MCFIHPPPTFPRSILFLSLYIQLWIPSKEKRKKKKTRPTRYVVFHWSMIDLTGATFRENCPPPLPLSQQLATANSVMAKGGILCPIPISILGLGQAEACTGPVYAVTTALSSYVQWSCVMDIVSL